MNAVDGFTLESGSEDLRDGFDQLPARVVVCPQCKNPTVEEDAWGERDPETGLLYPEPRLFCTTCQWVQPR